MIFWRRKRTAKLTEPPCVVCDETRPCDCTPLVQPPDGLADQIMAAIKAERKRP